MAVGGMNKATALQRPGNCSHLWVTGFQWLHYHLVMGGPELCTREASVAMCRVCHPDAGSKVSCQWRGDFVGWQQGCVLAPCLRPPYVFPTIKGLAMVNPSMDQTWVSKTSSFPLPPVYPRVLGLLGNATKHPHRHKGVLLKLLFHFKGRKVLIPRASVLMPVALPSTLQSVSCFSL